VTGPVARRESYQGYVLQADPYRRDGRWVPQVIIELHEEDGSVHSQVVSADPFVTYPTREEAERVSLQFGKTILDSRPSAR
jgi:hypothetical protein